MQYKLVHLLTSTRWEVAKLVLPFLSTISAGNSSYYLAGRVNPFKFLLWSHIQLYNKFGWSEWPHFAYMKHLKRVFLAMTWDDFQSGFCLERSSEQSKLSELVGLFRKFGWIMSKDQLLLPALIDHSEIQNKNELLVWHTFVNVRRL